MHTRSGIRGYVLACYSPLQPRQVGNMPLVQLRRNLDITWRALLQRKLYDVAGSLAFRGVAPRPNPMSLMGRLLNIILSEPIRERFVNNRGASTQNREFVGK